MSFFRPFRPFSVRDITVTEDRYGDRYISRVVTDRGTFARTSNNPFGWSNLTEQRDTNFREDMALRAICRDWATAPEEASQ